jgi:hypothetical protein
MPLWIIKNRKFIKPLTDEAMLSSWDFDRQSQEQFRGGHCHQW